MRTSEVLKEARPVIHLVEQIKSACAVSPSPQPQLESPVYQLPFVEKLVPHDVIFNVQPDNPVFLRPNDIERFYGIPASTVYDWITKQAETHFPTVKLAVKGESKRRLVLIPKRLLDEWLIEHSTLTKLKPIKRS